MNQPVTVYIPRDAAALAVGAEAVVAAIQAEADRRQLSVQIVRNGSRGLLWLEPLAEVATPAGRVAYGPITAADVPALFEAGWLQGGQHALGHGLTEDIPYLKNQQRLTFARVGITDPLSLTDYEAHGGWAGLRRALAMSGSEVIDEVTHSGLRGRGGAAFPTGIKWKTVADQPAKKKYIACNADEGDSGTFSDRLLMEGDPYALIEGMIIAGVGVGAEDGYIYIRSEYPQAIQTLTQAVEHVRDAGWLGSDIAGSGKRFEMHIRVGAGAYICGEETSMLESLEGRRGEVRYRPPLPAIQGLFGQPTVINNVITLATIPFVLAQGANVYRDFGMGRSLGTLPFQLAGNIRQGGLVERAFGLTLHELLYDFGGGSASGRPLRAAQVGGPLGAWLPPSQWEQPLDYETYASFSAMIGHGGIVAVDDATNMAQLAEYAMHFCAVESCGKCTPCRVGSVRGVEVIQKIRSGRQAEANTTLLRELCDTMMAGSLCGLGGMAPYPVLSVLEHFSEDFSTTDSPGGPAAILESIVPESGDKHA